jgi:hypothetical protein
MIPGKKPGQRIGLVKFMEAGYYPCFLDLPNYTTEQAERAVREFNAEHGISSEVAESAASGSMFGWHVPKAGKAIAFLADRLDEEYGENHAKDR